MESSTSRKFVITGTISKDTKTFGTTHEVFSEILREGFTKSFELSEKAHASQGERVIKSPLEGRPPPKNR